MMFSLPRNNKIKNNGSIDRHAVQRDQNRIVRKIFDQHPLLTDYLCHWSKTKRFIYVETPKVACTTIKRVLQQAETGGGCVYEKPGDVHNRQRSPLLSPKVDMLAFASAMHDKEYFRFCFVRNPFTRALSCYLDKMVKNQFERKRLAPKLGLSPGNPPSFTYFLHAVAEQKEEEFDIHWAPQTYLLRPNRVRYSFIGRFELFREQFRLVCKKLGITEYADDMPNTWHATNANEKVKDFLGKQEIELIHRTYEYDFRNFGYGWSPDVI